MNDAYIHYYAYWWDRGLYVQSEANLPVLWAQLSIYAVNNRSASCSFLLSKLE